MEEMVAGQADDAVRLLVFAEAYGAGRLLVERREGAAERCVDAGRLLTFSPRGAEASLKINTIAIIVAVVAYVVSDVNLGRPRK